MYDYLISHYYVDVYVNTNILDRWHLHKTEKFESMEVAITYAKHEIKRGNRTKVYEVSKVVGWE